MSKAVFDEYIIWNIIIEQPIYRQVRLWFYSKNWHETREEKLMFIRNLLFNDYCCYWNNTQQKINTHCVYCEMIAVCECRSDKYHIYKSNVILKRPSVFQVDSFVVHLKKIATIVLILMLNSHTTEVVSLWQCRTTKSNWTKSECR